VATGAATGAGACATGAAGATLLDSSFAVKATTAAVRFLISVSSDIERLLTSYRGLNYKTVFIERLDYFTEHFGWLAILLSFGVKFGSRLVCHSDNKER
jgi:hypothetical protein